MEKMNWKAIARNKNIVNYPPKRYKCKIMIGNTIKLLYAIGCFIGFLSQISMFSELYLKYPVRMEMETDFLTGPEIPAITVCNSNGFRKSETCGILVKKCPDLTKKNYHKLRSFLLGLYKTTTFAQKIKAGHQYKKLVSDCTPANLCFSKDPVQSYSFYTGNCYTINGNFTGNEPGSTTRETTVGGLFIAVSPNVLILSFDTESEEYLSAEEDSVKVQVHNGYDIPLNIETAFQLDKGFFYQMYITKATNKYLPPPYSTKCYDYKKAFVENGWKGPLSSQACVYQCIHKTTQECGYNTIMRARYPVLINDMQLVLSQLDAKINYTMQKCRSVKVKKICQSCAAKCPRPCEYTYFTSEIQRQTYNVRAMPVSKYWNVNGTSKVPLPDTRLSIVYKTLEHRVFVVNPQFQAIEIFSFVGGYIGIWLGVSLWSFPKDGYHIYYWFKEALHFK